MRGKSIVRRTPSHESGGAGVGREHLGDEDLRRISRQLDKEDHSEPDRQHHRLAPRIGPEQPEQGGEKKERRWQLCQDNQMARERGRGKSSAIN